MRNVRWSVVQVDELERFNHLQQEALLSDSTKPYTPPPMESFSQQEGIQSDDDVAREPAYPYLPPPQV